MKEHTIVVVMANAVYAGASIYATDILISREVFYGQKFGLTFQLLFVVMNQMLGFGLGGGSEVVGLACGDDLPE